MSVGGKVISNPRATHSRWTASTSSTQSDIQTPLSPTWSPVGPNVIAAGPLPPPPLAALAEEDLVPAGADGSERRRITPVPGFLPAELLEPGEARLDICDVQDRGDTFREHARTSR